MSSETRVLRPYRGAEVFQRIIGAAELIAPDRRWRGGERVAVDLQDYLNFPFQLRVDLSDRAVLASGAEDLHLSLDEIDLLVMVNAPRLRIAEIAFREPLGDLDLIPDRVELTKPDRPAAFRAPHGGANVEVFFCLNCWKEPRPLHPWRLGTWLGREEFRVRSKHAEGGFTPLKLTDADRERLGLPKETSSFATLEDHDPFDPEGAMSALRLYVDEEVLDRLAVASTAPAGRQLQGQMFLDAVGAIVHSAMGRVRRSPDLLEHHIDEFEGSLTHRVVSMVAGKGAHAKDSRQAAYRLMFDDPVSFLARVEAEIGMRSEILALLEEGR